MSIESKNVTFDASPLVTVIQQLHSMAGPDDVRDVASLPTMTARLESRVHANGTLEVIAYPSDEMLQLFALAKKENAG